MTEPSAPTTPAPSLSVRQAAFIGVAAMVGAGIFSLLGAAGEVAGAAVWLSFLIAGVVAILQGYSFAKLGSRFPSAGGLLEYVIRGYGDGHVAGVVGLVASVRQRHRHRHGRGVVRQLRQQSAGDASAGWTKAFAVLVVVVMAVLNIVGSKAVARRRRWS